jgi:hypothetical protein
MSNRANSRNIGVSYKRLFHGRVRQVEPLLQKVNAQHRFHSKRWTPTFGTTRRRVWRNQAHKLSPRHDQVHLVEELALARSLGLAFKSSGAQAHLLHAVTVSHSGLHAEVLQTIPSNPIRNISVIYRPFTPIRSPPYEGAVRENTGWGIQVAFP